MNKIIFVISIFFISCSVQKNNDSFSETLSGKLGEGYEKISNGTFTLCRSSAGLSEHKTFLVYNESTQEVVYGPVKLNAEVTWASTNELQIKEYPEVIENKQGSSTYTYYYNVLTGKKYEKTSESF